MLIAHKLSTQILYEFSPRKTTQCDVIDACWTIQKWNYWRKLTKCRSFWEFIARSRYFGQQSIGIDNKKKSKKKSFDYINRSSDGRLKVFRKIYHHFGATFIFGRKVQGTNLADFILIRKTHLLFLLLFFLYQIKIQPIFLILNHSFDSN